MDTRKDDAVKVLVVGKSGVGKTKLIEILCEQKSEPGYQPTKDLSFALTKDEKIKFWELAGSLKMEYVHGAHAKAVIYVADLTVKAEENLQNIKEFFAENAEKFVQAQLFIVFNKCDLGESNVFNEFQNLQLQREVRISKDFIFVCSAETNQSINELRAKLDGCIKINNQVEAKITPPTRLGAIPIKVNKLATLKTDIREHIKNVTDPDKAVNLLRAVRRAKWVALVKAVKYLEEQYLAHDFCLWLVKNPKYSESTGPSKTKKLVRRALEEYKPQFSDNLLIANLRDDIYGQRLKITFSFFGSEQIKTAKLNALEKCDKAVIEWVAGNIPGAVNLIEEAFRIKDFSAGMFWSNTFTLVNRVSEFVNPIKEMYQDL